MPEKFRSYLESLRLQRWPRSLAIIPGVVAFYALYPEVIDFSKALNIIWDIFWAFSLTWLISTANYIINEITDAPFDIYHPTKKNRPLVKNQINKNILIMLWFILVVSTFFIAWIVFNNLYISLSLFSLLLAGIIYNVPPIRVKDIPYLDSTIESINNPIRFLIGWYTNAVIFPPVFLLLCWWAFGNFLMVGKRVAEKKFLSEEESSRYRRSLIKYHLNHLIIFMILNAIVFITTFFLFIMETELHTFIYVIPFILIYLYMFMKKSLQDRDGAEEPEKLLKNPYYALYTILLVIIFIMAYITR